MDKFQTISLDKMIDKHIGKPGTEMFEAFDTVLKIELLDQAAKQGRQDSNFKLTA